jgi:transposase
MQAEKLKTLIIQIYPTTIQKNKIDEFIDTSRFVYNKAVALSKKIKVNFITMRDQLVTLDTKKNIEEYKEFDKILEVSDKLMDLKTIICIDDFTFPPSKNINISTISSKSSSNYIIVITNDN